MNNGRILFDKISLDYINRQMVGQQFENNWLECKQKSHANKTGLDESDKSNFAKALSGFANTSGGVVIFGLDARKVDGVDIIQSIRPVKNLRSFESDLRECESRVVERIVLGVEYRIIETAENEGLLAVYIPESAHLPHRSLRDGGFYIRAGGVFSPLDLNLIGTYPIH